MNSNSFSVLCCCCGIHVKPSGSSGRRTSQHFKDQMRAAQTEVSCCFSKQNAAFQKGFKADNNRSSVFYAMYPLFSSACFREEYRGRLDTVSQYHWSHLHIKPGVSPWTESIQLRTSRLT